MSVALPRKSEFFRFWGDIRLRCRVLLVFGSGGPVIGICNIHLGEVDIVRTCNCDPAGPGVGKGLTEMENKT